MEGAQELVRKECWSSTTIEGGEGAGADSRQILSPPPRGFQISPLPRGPQIRPPPRGLQISPPPRGSEISPPPRGLDISLPPRGLEIIPSPRGLDISPPPRGLEIMLLSEPSRLVPLWNLGGFVECCPLTQFPR